MKLITLKILEKTAILKMTEFYDGIKIESSLNSTDDNLPFGYYHPDYDGKVVWICDKDQDGRIIYVISRDHGDHKETSDPVVVKDMEQAITFRNMMIDQGWKKIKPPEITIKRPNGDSTPLSRQEKRFLKKKLNRMNKKTNPFLGIPS